MSFKKLPVPFYPSISEKEESEDSLYWKSGFNSPVISKEYGAVTRVEFCPTSPFDFAVTNSTRVQIYDSRSHQITRTLQRFQRQALSGSFRADGGLVVAGTEDGLVKVFDHQNQSLLRLEARTIDHVFFEIRYSGQQSTLIANDQQACISNLFPSFYSFSSSHSVSSRSSYSQTLSSHY